LEPIAGRLWAKRKRSIGRRCGPRTDCGWTAGRKKKKKKKKKRKEKKKIYLWMGSDLVHVRAL
jgi:hypothetical protein